MTKLALDINGGLLHLAPPSIFCRSPRLRNSLPCQLRKTNQRAISTPLSSNVLLNSNNQSITLLHLALGNIWTVPRQGKRKQAKSIICSQSAKETILEVEMPQAIDTDSVRLFGISIGQPSPLGVSQVGNKINFSLFAKHATSVTLCLFLGPSKGESERREIALDPAKHKTGDRWHVCIENLPLSGVFYGYRVDGPQGWEEGHRFDKNLILLDPYAKLVEGRRVFGDATEKMSRFLGTYDFSFSPFDWGDGYKRPEIPEEDLVIYEMNVRAFTADQSSGLEHSIRGSYLAVIEKIPHLLELGINAVQLLPVFEFDELELQRRRNPRDHMINTWGYSTMNFFSPMTRYAANGGGPLAASLEFKKMVKALHAAGIEVILDVVYNHTNEADDEHPYTTSFRGIDNKVYYMLDINSHVQLLNFSGCGNTLNCNHPVVMELILDSLRHWVTEYHVDGFRFDLASVLCRASDGNPLGAPPVVKAIAKDPVLSKCKIIAEPWDCGGLYLVGRFPNWDRWAEWNGKYRDDVRRFIKGDAGMKGSFATRLAGSSDLYKVNARKPYHSINFVIAHDGFTLYDLVAYNSKHNELNGEKGRDGCNDNYSWNCGFEGNTKDPGVNALRARQMKNFHLALMVSQGTPMILMADEYGHTRYGNNNSYGHDNALNHFQWNQLESRKQSYFRFFAETIKFRRQNPLLGRSIFLTQNDVTWHENNWHNPDSRFLAFTLHGGKYGCGDLYIAFNAHDYFVKNIIPSPPFQKCWYRVVDTNLPAPDDFIVGGVPFKTNVYNMAPYSAILFCAEQN